MDSALERLISLRVGDAMSRSVVVVDAAQSLASAAARMAERGVSCAPVVNDHGHCVGMLSATDYLRHGAAAGLAGATRADEHALTTSEQGWQVPADGATAAVVSKYMSPGLQTVSATEALLAAGRIMCEAHLHRLPVLDECRYPVGIISSLDIVSAVVKSLDEQQRSTRSK